MFTVIFTPAARAELIDAQDWYEAEASGLGRRFRHAIHALAERMSANPRQFPVVFKNVRRALLRRGLPANTAPPGATYRGFDYPARFHSSRNTRLNVLSSGSRLRLTKSRSARLINV